MLNNHDAETQKLRFSYYSILFMKSKPKTIE